jgi:hypothetical protein
MFERRAWRIKSKRSLACALGIDKRLPPSRSFREVICQVAEKSIFRWIVTTLKHFSDSLMERLALASEQACVNSLAGEGMAECESLV